MVLARLFTHDGDEIRLEIAPDQAMQFVEHDSRVYLYHSMPTPESLGYDPGEATLLWETLAYPEDEPDTYRLIMDYRELREPVSIP
jgi:hypothetical protein